MSRLQRLTARLGKIGSPGDRAKTQVATAGIDLMGCILLGASHPAASGTRTALAGCTGSAAVFGAGIRLASPVAALANAIAGHCLDFDDWEEPGNTHPSTVLLPALWAVAAERGHGGRAVADAYRIGFEVIARLGQAVTHEHYTRGWHSTATLGVIGAAAGTARLIGLEPDRMAHAIAIAITQASGYTCQFGSDAKPLQAGFAARDGVTAALLAEQGLTGQPGVLDSPRGFLGLMCTYVPDRLDAAIDRIDGSALEQWGLGQKSYPSCGYTHRLIDCARALSPEIDPARIERIEAEIPDFQAEILPYRHPKSRSEALFSIPYCVVTALRRGTFTLSDLDESAITDPASAALIDRTVVRSVTPKRPEMNYDPDQPDRVSVTLDCGQVLTRDCAYPSGAPQNPLSLAEVRAKTEAIAGPYPVAAFDALMDWTSAPVLSRCLEPFENPP